MSDFKQSVYLRGKVVAICEAMLPEEMGNIAEARILNRLELELLHNNEFGSFDRDEDFFPFIAIDSETDHLRVDIERQNWSEEALAEKDEEIKAAEQWAKDIAVPACKRLIERFSIEAGE